MINYRTHREHILRIAFGTSLLVILLLAGLVNAQGAMYPEAKLIVLSKESNVSVTFEGSDASFNNSFGLWSPRYQELFWGHSTSPNTTFDLGYFPSYTELIFFINNSQNTFLSGPGNRNPDGVVHAAITEIDSQTWRVGFEDTLGGGDHDYNDITVLVKGGLYVIPPNPQKPDFLVLPEDITFSNNNPTEGDIVEIQAKVHNLGNSTDSNVSLGFYDGDPDNGGQLISTTTINGIGKEENVTKTIQWNTTGKAGTHNIYVKVDPENLIDEVREDNNKANKEIVIAPTLTTPPPPTPLPPPAPAPTFSITGTVFIDTNQDGVQDNGEQGYSGATVTLTTRQSVTTDANGNYIFSNLPSATYVVALTVPDGYKATTQSLVNIELNGNAIQNFGIVQTTITPPIPEPVPIPQQPSQPPIKDLGSISGFKINDLNSNGIKDAGDVAIPGWKITLNGITSSDTKTIVKETTTDNQGFYIFDNLPAGTYLLTEEVKENFIPTTPVKSVVLAPGQDSKDNNFMNVMLLIPLPPPAPIQPPTAPTPTPIYGEKFGTCRGTCTTEDEKGELHHYVYFRIDPPRIPSKGWRVEGPVPSWFPLGGTDPDPWPQKFPDYVRAGFHWRDPPFPGPECCIKPSNYRLYER